MAIKVTRIQMAEIVVVAHYNPPDFLQHPADLLEAHRTALCYAIPMAVYRHEGAYAHEVYSIGLDHGVVPYLDPRPKRGELVAYYAAENWNAAQIHRVGQTIVAATQCYRNVLDPKTRAEVLLWLPTFIQPRPNKINNLAKGE